MGLTGLVTVFSCSAHAQSAAVKGDCASSFRISDDAGLARIELKSDCRRGEKIRAAVGTSEQVAEVDQTGTARFVIILTQPATQISILYQDGSSELVDARFATSQQVMRITLQWFAPVDLDLHIIEPRGIVGGSGDSASAPTTLQFGKQDLVDNATGFGPFKESYVVADRVRHASAVFAVAIENVSRGRVAMGAHCLGGELAKVAVSLTVIDRGEIKHRNIELPTFTCGQKLSDTEYYQRVHF
jgi:hypothetical protein